MACQNCGCKNKPCGCEDTPLTTPAPCNPIGCPDPYPCSEVINAECVVYTGPDLECNNDVVIAQDTTLAEALADAVSYFCENSGGSVSIVQEGSGIDVTSSTVGSTTTYTVSAVCPLFVQITEVQADRLQANVSGGTAPYTYVWSMADNWLGGNTQSMFTLNATIQPNVVAPVIFPVNPTDSNTFDFAASAGGRVGLDKVVVTDANGCKASDTYLLLYGVIN